MSYTSCSIPNMTIMEITLLTMLCKVSLANNVVLSTSFVKRLSLYQLFFRLFDEDSGGRFVEYYGLYAQAC